MVHCRRSDSPGLSSSVRRRIGEAEHVDGVTYLVREGFGLDNTHAEAGKSATQCSKKARFVFGNHRKHIGAGLASDMHRDTFGYGCPVKLKMTLDLGTRMSAKVTAGQTLEEARHVGRRS